jgi:hypothetical protein
MASTMPAFEFRALEMHGDRMWSWRWVKRAIDTAADCGMNALVFHRNDIIDMLVFPRRYFSVEEIWARWPVRYHNIDNNRQYLRHVMRYAGARGLAMLLEVKEVSFHDSLLGKHPGLWTGRGICASDPFWWEFLEAKLEELLDALPELAGVIVSPATRETRVTISANECDCARCRATEPVDWYEALIGAMFRPLSARGKTLAVRDFSYTRGNQGAVLQAAGRVSEQIVISLKNTPHDYYPTFPDNPRIGNVGRHPQWVEFDTWGQFFGLGVFPCIVLEDMQARFAHCGAQGVRGVMARTDWEVISDGSVFDTLNLANLTGFARLARGDASSAADLLARQLGEPLATALGGGLDEAHFDLAACPEARAALHAALSRSWEVMAKTVFVLRHVFHEDCMFPDTLRKAFMMLVEVHGLAEWEPSAVGALTLHEDVLAAIFREKDEAVALVEDLAGNLVRSIGSLPEPGRSQLRDTAELWILYVHGFRACARACFAVQFHRERRGTSTRDAAAQEIAALEAYRARLGVRLEQSAPTYLVSWMLDTARLDSLAADLSAQIRMA